MKIRVYKEVIEVGQYRSYGGPQSFWEIEKVIEEAKEVERYVEDSRKPTTGYGGGLYISKDLGTYVIRFYPLGTTEVK